MSAHLDPKKTLTKTDQLVTLNGVIKMKACKNIFIHLYKIFKI